MNFPSVFCTCATLALLIHAQYVESMENPDCKPRKVVVQVGNPDKPGDGFYAPAAVEVYRCSGHHEISQRCVAMVDGIKEVSFPIRHKYGKNDNFSESKMRVFKNHTRCEMRCSCDSRFVKCQNTNEYIVDCPNGFAWDFSFGKCGCGGVPNVGCNKNDGDDEEVSISLTMFVLALVIEFIIVLIAIFLVMDACKFRRRDSGIFHKTAEFIRSVSNRPPEGNITLRKDRSDTGSESFLNNYSAGKGNAV